jgi:hypothetical protein
MYIYIYWKDTDQGQVKKCKGLLNVFVIISEAIKESYSMRTSEHEIFYFPGQKILA